MSSTTLIPTTIRFQPSLLHRLKSLAEEKGQTLSELVELSIRNFIDQQEKKRVDQMYSELFKIAEASQKKLADKPIKKIDVDEELYGSKGAWKGNHE